MFFPVYFSPFKSLFLILPDLAFLEIIENLVLLLFANFRHGGAFRENDAVPLPVEFDHLEADAGANQVRKLARCIRVVAAENTAEDRVSAGERYARIYEINMSRCIFCGYCELACPFDAITLGNEFEIAEYSRDDLIYTKDMLLAEPIKRVPVADPALYDTPEPAYKTRS